MDYLLTLFITGNTPRSRQAVSNLQSLCNRRLSQHITLEIIDVLEVPDLAEEWRILATPTLIKKSPLPIKRIIGDLTDLRTLERALELSDEESRT